MANRDLNPVGDVSGLLALGRQLDTMARAAGIQNVFDDNGYKTLFLVNLLGIKVLKRDGDDAVDQWGRTYELTTVNRVSAAGVRKRDSELNVTTEHTMTLANLVRYRKVEAWIIAVFDGPMPECVYVVSPVAPEPLFAAREALLRAVDPVTKRPVITHLNNRKIPRRIVVEKGRRLWSAPTT